MSVIIAGLKLDAESRMAAMLFAIPAQDEHGIARIEERFGKPAAHLVNGISRLNKLRPITKGFVAANLEAGEVNPVEMKAQIEVLRKMLLAMVEDIRVVCCVWPAGRRPCVFMPPTRTTCASRWRAKRWNFTRRWPTGSVSGN
jgi:(p)ppGpp synthase/HD superfamily hydrolase